MFEVSWCDAVTTHRTGIPANCRLSREVANFEMERESGREINSTTQNKIGFSALVRRGVEDDLRTLIRQFAEKIASLTRV